MQKNNETNIKNALSLNESGWLNDHNQVLIKPSPNYNQRPPKCDVSLLVIHNISLPPGIFGGDQIIDFFLNRLDISSHPWFVQIADLKVSAHFLIRRTGQTVQFVSTQQRAWHAGISNYQGRKACNDFSIGVELEGTDHKPYENAQYAALNELTQAIRASHSISAVQGHEHIAPQRKTDPGPAFDWARYKQESNLQGLQLP